MKVNLQSYRTISYRVKLFILYSHITYIVPNANNNIKAIKIV